jgi:hypothetical protein
MFRSHGTIFRVMYDERTLLTCAFKIIYVSSLKIIRYTFRLTKIRGCGMHCGCSDYRDVLFLYRLRMEHWEMLCWQFSYIPCGCLSWIRVSRDITKLNALHYPILRKKPM